jgi:hypothetical protein
VARECKSKKVCVYCKESDVHHRSLCPKKFQKESYHESVHVSDERGETTLDSEGEGENALLSTGETVLMQTATTLIQHPSGVKEKVVRVLLDTGSQRTYVTKRLAKELNLNEDKEQEIRLVTFGEKPKVIKTKSTQLRMKLKNGHYMTLNANIVPLITESIHRKPISIHNQKNFKELAETLDLADRIPVRDESSTIELLIGNDYYLDLVGSHKIEVQQGLYLLASKLGWLLTGRSSNPECNQEDINMFVMTYGTNHSNTEVFTATDKSLSTNKEISDLWDLESIGINESPMKADDENAMKNFRDTLIFKDNRYHVKWPWKNDEPNLPVNRELAVGRLNSFNKEVIRQTRHYEQIQLCD